MSATSNDVNDDVLKATKTYRQQRRHVIGLYLLALLVMMVLFGWLLSEQYRQEIEAAESRITARANVVAEWAKGVFAQSGQALFGLAEMLTLQGMPDSDNAQALQRSLENLTLYVPMVDEIAVLSAEGRVMASGRSSRRAGADISDTTLFNAFKQAGQEELITPLYWSISDQRYYLYHGRRLETSSGEFAGVVISSIVPEVFADALEQMSVYDGESIALVDPGLKFIARYPTPEKPFSIGSQIESPETAEWLTRGESTWSINIDSPIDGRKRLFRMLRVGEYPMLAVVGVDLHELLSAWRQRALILMLVTAVIALLGAWGARHYLNRLALSHQLRQRIEEREQARAEAQIAAAAFQTHLGILITDPQGIILKVNETFSRITGYSEAEIVGNNPRMFSSGYKTPPFTAVYGSVLSKPATGKARYGTSVRMVNCFPSG